MLYFGRNYSYIVYILLIIQFIVTKKLVFHSVHSLGIFLSVFDYFLQQIKASLWKLKYAWFMNFIFR